MGKRRYVLADAGGRRVSFSEETSIVLTAAMVFAVLGLILVGALLVAEASSSGSLEALVAAGMAMGFIGVNVPVLNHLRRKADMSVDSAVFLVPGGGGVRIYRKKSVVLTVAAVLAGILLAASVILFAAGAAGVEVAGSNPEAALLAGFAGIALSLPLLRALQFLRVKLEFPGDELVIMAGPRGGGIRLYKKSSLVITVALAVVLILGVGALALAAGVVLAAGGGHGVLPAQVVESIYSQAALMGVGPMGAAAALGVMGLGSLLYAAGLNFLRVRAHVEPVYAGSAAGPIASPQQEAPAAGEAPAYIGAPLAAYTDTMDVEVEEDSGGGDDWDGDDGGDDGW